MRVPKDFDQVVWKLSQGVSTYESIANRDNLSRVMTACLSELGVEWQTCVALCYFSMKNEAVEDSIASAAQPQADPLEAFLAAKDAELARWELDNKSLSLKLPAARGKAVTA